MNTTRGLVGYSTQPDSTFHLGNSEFVSEPETVAEMKSIVTAETEKCVIGT